MEYADILKMVRQQNSEMPYKEAQKLAKSKYAEFKQQADIQRSTDKPFPQPQKEREKLNLPTEKKAVVKKTDVEKTDETTVSNPGEISIDQLMAAEKRIRDLSVGRSNIVKVGKEYMPTGDLVTHGKDGVNTLVTFEDQYGNKIPVEGYFKIWL